jgi:hypothetical protein
MSSTAPIVMGARVVAVERPIIELAVRQLEASLNAASASGFSIRIEFIDPETVAPPVGARIVLISLRAEAIRLAEPWLETERRLRGQCKALLDNNAIVFVCAVFRHVSPGHDMSREKRIRIRRLNLLVTEISRETGLFVIDLDRELADIGANNLKTDYLLAGPLATAVAANCIAKTVLSYGLDDYVPFEIQDGAKPLLEHYRPTIVNSEMSASQERPLNFIATGSGRRTQIVSTVVDTDQNRHAGALVQLFLRRQISIQEALAKLRQSVARRGLRSSSALFLAGIRQVLRKSSRAGK